MTKQRDPKITIQEIILACENAIQFVENIVSEQLPKLSPQFQSILSDLK